jgi:triacylglycerol lipase
MLAFKYCTSVRNNRTLIGACSVVKMSLGGTPPPVIEDREESAVELGPFVTSSHPPVERGPLDADARRFLDRYGAALALPASGVDTEAGIAAYLAGERSRLTATPGAALLRPNAREVVTRQHVVGEDVAVRSYVPAGTGSAGRPVVLYIHGGGWVTGSIELHDSTCRVLAAEGDLVVFNVGYRLAPEHPYPGPLDDCDRVLQWVRGVADELTGADPTLIAVVGTSAGGNLAAALALRARNRRVGEIALQVLIYPALDSRMSGASHRPEVNGRDYFVSAEHMRWYWERYRGTGRDLDDDPRFSPLAATNLAGLPPAVIVTAEFDLLRDDGAAYHDRLVADGVASRRIHHPGQIHGFMTLFDDIRAAYPAVAELAVIIRESLHDIHRDRRNAGVPAPPKPAIDVQKRLEPGTLAMLDRLARWDVTSIETIRATYAAIRPAPVPPAPGVERADAIIPGVDGRPDVPARWYRPAEARGALPCLVYFHGGAYVMGSLDENDDRLDQLVLELGCAVLSVDWRLAPEHPYPAGLDDAETVWLRVTQDAAAYDVDPARLVAGGASAGAGLAAALCLRLRETRRSQPALQLLVYPMLDDREATPSIRALEGGPGHWGLWHLRAQRLAWQAYLGPLAGGDVPPSAAPARAEDLSGLAPAFLAVGDVDAYVDENVQYAARLSHAGVPTELHVYPGVIHGGFSARPTTPRTTRFLRDVYAALAEVFGPAGDEVDQP